MNQLPDGTAETFKRLVENGLSTAIFDLDGTLARTDITQLYFFLRRRSFSRALSWHLWHYAMYLAYGPAFLVIDHCDRPTFQRLFFRWYSRFSLAELSAAAADFFATVGKHRLNQGTAALLDLLKSEGVHVEIHSTNMASFVARFAEHFGVAYKALPVEAAPDGGCRVRTEQVRSFKVDALKPFDLSRTAIIADSRSDLPALRAAAYPVVVSPWAPRWAEPFDMPVMSPSGILLRPVSDRFLRSAVTLSPSARAALSEPGSAAS